MEYDAYDEAARAATEVEQEDSTDLAHELGVHGLYAAALS